MGRHLARRAFLASSVATLATSLIGCGGNGEDPPPEVAGATVRHNGKPETGLPMRYEDLGTPRLAQLSQRENLAHLAAEARDEFDLMLRLKEWVAMQFPHSTPDPYPPWDAIAVLDWIRAGLTGGYCAQFAQVYLQALASFGLLGRYVELGSRDNPYAHYVMEAWSNQFDKWVVMDVDYNMHFERDGVPMSALEVHDAFVGENMGGVRSVLGDFRNGHPDPRDWPFELAELYYYVRVHLKADHLSTPDEVPFDRQNDMVEFDSPLTVPWEASPVESVYPKVRLTQWRTAERALFDAKLNQVDVSVEKVAPAEVTLHAMHDMHAFWRFEVRERSVGDEVAPWRDVGAGPRISWRPNPAADQFELRAVNTLGAGGPPAVVQVTFR